MRDTQTVFDVQHVSRTYHHPSGNVAAVSDATFTISRGEFLAVVGPSGSGKSTLLHLLGAIDHPESGSVLFDGKDYALRSATELTAIRRSQLGFVFQSFNLVPVLSAYENVEYGLWLAGVPRGERRKRVTQALEQVGLLHRKDHRPDHLSGGERQRIAIARALVMNPLVVLADEPVVHPDDLPRFAQLGVAATAQPYWAVHERQMDELTIPFVRPELAARQYPWRSLLRHGATLAMGSDWSVSTPDPLAQIEVAVTRVSDESRGRREPFLPDERLELVDALTAFTSGSAYVNHLDETGRLRVGLLADLVVLDRDLLDPGAGPIGETRVVATFVDGAPVFEDATLEG